MCSEGLWVEENKTGIRFGGHTHAHSVFPEKDNLPPRAPGGLLTLQALLEALEHAPVPIMGLFSSSWMLQTQFLSSSCLSPLAAACHLSEEESQHKLSTRTGRRV